MTSLRTYLELMRLSNGPTIITNVLVGTAIGIRFAANITTDEVVHTFMGITIAVLLFYVAGMILNDVVDADIDRGIRPDAPIPSREIPRRKALVIAILCMVFGLTVSALYGIYALILSSGLAGTITAYDLLHNKTSLAVILMGLCRAGVYLLAAAAIAWPLDWKIAGVPTGAIATYIILLTLVARVESRQEKSRRFSLSFLLPVVILMPCFFIRPQIWIWVILAGVATTGWLLYCSNHLKPNPPRIKHAVQGWLAGICLVDAYFLTLLDQPVLALIAGVCFILTLICHRFIAGT